MDLDDFQRHNRANWDDRVPVHLASDTYDVQRYVDEPDRVSDVVAFDAPLLGDVRERSIVHLQCHIGTDTISLARLGASEVVGVDFSERAIAAARDLAARTGAPASFVVANVYDAAEVVGRPFDVVYTSVGAINWLADLDRWAAAVTGLLEPGGRFYVRDLHPALYVFEEIDGRVVPFYDYFTPTDDPLSFDDQETYTDGDASAITNTRTYEWNHPLPEIVNALVNAGLVIDRMAEHEGFDWPAFPSAVREGSQWFLPPELRGKLPTMFSLWAHKPA